MPELPEVEMVVRGLRDDLIGRTFTGVDVHWAREIEGMSPDAFTARVTGQQIQQMWRRAKYIVMECDDDYLLVHLRMTGRLYITTPDADHDADRWLRVTFKLDDGRELRFSDMRKFGRVYLTADLEAVLGGLGPEPLSDAFTQEVFQQQLDRRSGVIKPLLLNQSFVAGIGNIYADEALWHARIDPRRRADTLTDAEAAALYQGIRRALSDGIKHEGSSFSWYRKPDGSPGGYQKAFKVYGRADEPCPRCGTRIQKIRLAQRGTHFCPECQI